jgi:hypothetical protein
MANLTPTLPAHYLNAAQLRAAYPGRNVMTLHTSAVARYAPDGWMLVNITMPDFDGSIVPYVAAVEPG